MTVPAIVTRFETIDDCLGPGAGRFFAEGFKRVEQGLNDVRVQGDPAGEAVVSATASVRYPPDWSRKAGGMDLRPHLSSIDTLVLAVRLAEIWLTHRYGLEPAERATMWLRGFTMRAGTRPQEDLVGFEVQAERTTLSRDPSVPGGHVSQLDCRIGAVRVRCVIAHPIGRADQAPGPDFYRADSDLLGDPEQRYYGNGFRRRQQNIREVQIAADGQRADAVIQVEPGADGTEQLGLGAAYAPTLSMLDSMTALAQVAQVLLYHQDGLRRGQTNTLWLRKVTMQSATPDQPMAEPFPAPVEITASDLVRRDEGRWRSVAMTGHFQGIQARSSLAHQLPE